MAVSLPVLGAEAALAVLSRAGAVHSQGERTSGRSAVMEWRPSGELLAAAVKHAQPPTHVVALYERNGLRHGQLALRDAAYAVADLKWNATGDVLAVVLEAEGEAAAEAVACKVQLWARGNYHWYLLWERCLPRSAHRVLVQWDREQPHTLHLVSATAALSLGFAWATVVSAQATAAVVDGHELQLTPFEVAVIPPPMAATKLSLVAEERVCAVAWSAQGHVLLHTSSGALALVKVQRHTMPMAPPQLVATVTCASVSTMSTMSS